MRWVSFPWEPILLWTLLWHRRQQFLYHVSNLPVFRYAFTYHPSTTSNFHYVKPVDVNWCLTVAWRVVISGVRYFFFLHFHAVHFMNLHFIAFDHLSLICLYLVIHRWSLSYEGNWLLWEYALYLVILVSDFHFPLLIFILVVMPSNCWSMISFIKLFICGLY